MAAALSGTIYVNDDGFWKNSFITFKELNGDRQNDMYLNQILNYILLILAMYTVFIFIIGAITGFRLNNLIGTVCSFFNKK